MMESLRTGNQNIGGQDGTGDQLGHQRKPTEFGSKASLADGKWKD